MSKKIALILSGGTGMRLGTEIPKQYLEVNGKMIIEYCLEKFKGKADLVVVVAAEEWQDRIQKAADKLGMNIGFALPGETRQLSILSGLRVIDALLFISSDMPVDTIFGRGEGEPGNISENTIGNVSENASENGGSAIVLIHDAARPLVSGELIDRCFAAVEEGHDGAIPVIPMKDTVYLSEDGSSVSGLLERSKLFAGQAPEAFSFGKYLLANERLLPDDIYKINGSTEPAVLAGMDIKMIPGDEGNFKITTKADLERFKEIV